MPQSRKKRPPKRVLALLIGCGLRSGELLSLTLEAIQRTGSDPVSLGTCVDPDDRTLPRMQTEAALRC